MKITIYQDPTEEELEAIKRAEEILNDVDLELIGTRPIRDRG